MSLKRKASFPSIASPQLPQSAIDRRFMDDSPKHLHCRTRKRVRNDRPDDQAVYGGLSRLPPNGFPDSMLTLETDKTLRWLFTAQQRVQQIPIPPIEPEQDENMEPEAPPAFDPRQQTLLQFFRPTQPQPYRQPSQQPCPSIPIDQLSSEPGPSRSGIGFLHDRDVGSVSPSTASDGETMTPASQLADRDMDMDMDMNWHP
ncbi:uncharacterized protein BDW70DRAFT_155666 [Aspergillus foveolatus]|uniref:uncharacterized protein n=1 Tax=Aspergillus foveolatus TaxID=210207 RepID=UPI003CCE4E49